MQIINTAVNATGDWYRVNRNEDIAIGATAASVFGGATVAIQTANESKVQLTNDSLLSFTAGFNAVLSLKEGMHIRAVVSGATGTTSIQVDAFPQSALALAS